MAVAVGAAADESDVWRERRGVGEGRCGWWPCKPLWLSHVWPKGKMVQSTHEAVGRSGGLEPDWPRFVCPFHHFPVWKPRTGYIFSLWTLIFLLWKIGITSPTHQSLHWRWNALCTEDLVWLHLWQVFGTSCLLGAYQLPAATVGWVTGSATERAKIWSDTSAPIAVVSQTSFVTLEKSLPGAFVPWTAAWE